MKKLDRREFVKCTALTTVATAATISATGGRAFAQGKDKDGDGMWTAELGSTRDLNEKHPVLVKAVFKDDEGAVVLEEKVFVRWEKINENTGRWIILSAICQHLKCKVDFSQDEHKFICPCHGSQYDIDGQVIKRPSKKDLPDYSSMAVEEDGRLLLKRQPE